MFARLRGWLANTPDRAWRPTGIKQLSTGYDESKAVASAKRARELADKSRDLAQQRAGLGKSAIITDISDRRAR